MASVVVVIPCRNMSRYLGSALESVFSQTVLPAEVVVVDDGSTDDPRAVVARFGDRVRLLDGPCIGSAAARNLGILSSSSEFVAFLDADDYWRPGHLAASLAALEDPAVGLTYADWQHDVDGSLQPPVFGGYYSAMTEGEAFSSLLRENWILCSSVVVRRRCLASSGLFDPALLGGQDFELWLRLARVCRFARVREVTSVKRDHQTNITVSSKYVVYQWWKWRTIHQRHADACPLDRQRIVKRASDAAFAAGRRLLIDGAIDAARECFRQSVELMPWRVRTRVWRVTSVLAGDFLGGVLRSRDQARRSSTSPGGSQLSKP